MGGKATAINMKILVLSDSHGSLKNLKTAVDKFSRNADIIVHCGDGTRNDAMWLKDYCKGAMVVCVRGNCDSSMYELKNEEFLDVEGKKIMITHGNYYSVKSGLERLAREAEEKNSQIVFFGHTHTATDQTLGNVRLINPGSCGYYNPTCAVVEIDNKNNILVNHLSIPET